jgi:thiamine biosynthesis lipoprotein
MSSYKKKCIIFFKNRCAFDITYKSEGFLWEKNSKNLPFKQNIQKTLKLVGIKNIEINCNKNTVFLKHKGVKIDLGGVAKGYSIDKTGEILKKAKISNFIVNYGGDMLVCGKKGNKNWIVGIKNPLKTGFLKTIVVKQKCEGIATSGDYERFVFKKNKKYSHIINPKTGNPVEEAHSVTVIAKNAIDADAFATAISVKHKDLNFIKKIVDKNGLKVYTLFGDERNVRWREF